LPPLQSSLKNFMRKTGGAAMLEDQFRYCAGKPHEPMMRRI
jgi:hypothetical protein